MRCQWEHSPGNDEIGSLWQLYHGVRLSLWESAPSAWLSWDAKSAALSQQKCVLLISIRLIPRTQTVLTTYTQ